MLLTELVDGSGALAFGPGDYVQDVYSKPLLGPCACSLHLGGYWFDASKVSPMIYLLLCSLAPPQPQP